MITTTTIVPPEIKYHYDCLLLDPLLGLIRRVESKIIPKANRKIRPQDIGKRREFNKLLEEFKSTYERKKAEEAEYKAAFKEAKKKRPGLPFASNTIKFKKI